MTRPDPDAVVVRTLAEHPPVDAGGTGALRMVAPGVQTAGRFGAVRFTPGIAGEEFSAEMAGLWRSGRTPSPEEMAACYAQHDQVMIDV